jgi:Co/Zn/Cd efflux system component
MKKLEKSTVTLLQEKVTSFTHEVGSFVNPAQAWDAVTEKVNEFKSSDAENKFVTMSAFMNLISALIQITFGLMLKSMSVISSAIDSLLDFVL